jgi:ClpP class serine protease
MKVSRFLLILQLHLLLLCLFSINKSSSFSLSKKVETSLENSIIEPNPEFSAREDIEEGAITSVSSGDDSDEESDFDSDDDDDEDDDDEDVENSDDYDDEEDDDEEDSKSKLNKSLSSSSHKSISKKAIQILTNNRTILTTTLAIYAFRREIKQLLLHLFTTKYKTEDGKVIRKLIFTLNPTSILKIILFIDFMRKLQQNNGSIGGGDGMEGSIGSSSSSGGGIIGHLLKDLLLQSNHAFIPPVEQHYTFEKINDRYMKDGYAWKKVTASSGDLSTSSSSTAAGTLPRLSKVSLFNRTVSSSSQSLKSTRTNNNNPSVVVIDMKIDSNVNTMPVIRDQISFLIHQHRLNVIEMKRKNTDDDSSISTKDKKDNEDNEQSVELVVNNANDTSQHNQTDATVQTDPLETTPQLEVIILLESPGGSATDYGLASYQIRRLRKEPGIKVTICVDKVAASGGYMMACMASPGQLYAAPFALLGSIGVYGQTLNIHNTLQNWGVKPLVFRGGKDKAPVGIVGEITKEGIAKVQGMIDKTHSAFKRHVVEARPLLANDIDVIATGDVWLGHDALERGLIDQIITSDEYIWDKIQNGDQVLKLIKFHRPRLGFFGGPRYGPGVPGVFHSSMLKVSDMLSDFKATLQKVNSILDNLSINENGNNDMSKIVHATAFGPEMKIQKPAW